MKHLYCLAFLILILPTFMFSQRNCATMEVLEQLKAQDPTLEKRMEAIERQTQEFLKSGAVQNRATVTIPVVVHVVYRTSAENISDAQIQSQIDVLNQDFKALNSDISNTPSEFAGVIGNPDIEFCLASLDPQGNPTNGITRKYASRSSWGTSDRVKRASLGGENPWDATKYLNLWVCNIGGGILGYAQFPGGSTATDGVVIDYRYLGTIGTATPPFNKGRTATHEIGHWFNLRHIWGDASCGNDFVADTPVHNASNSGCPAYPHYSTCSGNPLEMTMNYMDYTDDRCMYMFSAGQVARMRAVLVPGGARAGLLSSNACQGSSGGGSGGNDGGGNPTPCDAPTGLNATNITTNSATLNWNAVANASSYNVQLRPIGSSTWTTGSTSSNSINATNLSSATAYEFQVQTVCGSATSANYAAANFTTNEEPTNNNCTDTYESNDVQSAAKTIALNTPINALIGTSSDLDWYKFTISSAQRNIRIQLTNLPADYDLRLYRNSTLVGSSTNSNTADEQIIYNNASTSSTYYIRVKGYNRAYDALNCYRLLVETSGSAFRTAEGGEAKLESLPSLLLYPNPAQNELTLDVPVETDAPTQITIFDITGKQLSQTTADLTKGNTIKKLDISQLANGMYVVRVQNGDFIATKKFVVSK